MSTLATVFGYGLLSARAAASVAGRFYYATDTTLMYRDNGSTWDTLSVGTGSMATDSLWDAAGDLAQGTGANTGAKLSAGSVGQMLRSAGAAAANTWAYPPGYEYNHTEATSAVTSITATTEATATTIITASAGVAYDGSTAIRLVFSAPYATIPTDAGNRSLSFWLYDDTGGGAASVGRLGTITAPVVLSGSGGTIYGGGNMLCHVEYRLTPSNATHTYSVRASVNAGTGAGAAVQAGAGGNGAIRPMYIAQRKA